jgi:hypothetical protein
MRRKRPLPSVKLSSRFQPQLMVTEYVSTRRGDEERGPMLRINSAEAKIRLIQDGELAWVQGPRRKELAVVVIDDEMPVRAIALRDIAGVALSEHVTVTKPDLDNPPDSRSVG